MPKNRTDRPDEIATDPALEARATPDASSPAPRPANEAGRQRTLDAYRILDSGRDARFEELVAEVADVCGSPIATITFVDRDRQWFKAAIGLPFDQTDRDVAFCAHTILEPDAALVVEDTTRDPRFAQNPLVLGDPHLMAYAGAPMVAPDGSVLGTVCAMDYEPREFSPQQLAVLERVAAQVVELLDATSAAERLLGMGAALGAEADDIGGAAAPGPEAIGREGSPDEVLELTRPLIEAIGEEVDIVEVVERFCHALLTTFGWWAARIAWVQGDVLRSDAWMVAPTAPPVLAGLHGMAAAPVVLDDLHVQYRDPAVHDIGMLRWVADRDLVAGLGGRQAIVLDVPGATSLAARLVLLLPSARALSASAVRTLTTAAAVLSRVFVQDRARRELTYRATHDVLTGLLNREGLERRYQDSTPGRPQARAVLYIDVDGFKRINDVHGHRAGDEILGRIANQLTGRIRPTDTAARLGGDEFLVVLDGILHEDEALRVARRLLQALCGAHTVFHTERVELAVSIGLVLWRGGATLDAVIDAADRMMYSAKELGGASIAAAGADGRRLLGVDAGDERDLDVALSGAVQVVVAPVRSRSGAFAGVRAAVSAEVRHPDVDDMVELILQGVEPLLEDVTEGGLAQVLLAPASMLWVTDGLVLRMLVALATSLPQCEFRLLLVADAETDDAVRQAIGIRDALGVGLVVADFGSARGELGLLDRVAPVALELSPDILPSSDRHAEPASALIAARALAGLRRLTIIVPEVSGVDLAEIVDDDGLVVDLAAAIVCRREPPRPASAATERRRRS
jgi:diguanylate cyclase (GGDEF)-like protein